MEKAIERFQQYIKSRYPDSTTARHYVHDLQMFKQLVDKPPQAVTREDVDRFVEDQLERGLAATTVNRRLVALHELFEYLAEENPAEEWPNPVNWKRHRVKENKPLPRDVKEADIERLFSHIDHPRDKALFRLMLDVGLRVGEVVELQLSDLEPQRNNALSRMKVRGKGQKERYVWLMPETRAVLQEWLDQRPAGSNQALFITRLGKAFSVRGVQERLSHYCRRAEVKVSPHQLRHSFGRRMAEGGMPVTSLAAMLGHEQVHTTQVYIAGAGVEVQADYQAAITRLEAARQTGAPAGESEFQQQGAPTYEMDVWTLAGVEPGSETSQPAAPRAKMDLSRYWQDLPDWLTNLLKQYITYRQHRWKPDQIRAHTKNKMGLLRRFWRGLLEQTSLESLADLKREHLQGFVEAKLQAGLRSGSVNTYLLEIKAFLRYCQEHGQVVSPSVLRVKPPKPEGSLPRFLNETDYHKLEEHILLATQAQKRYDCFDRLWFYLLSEAGLRVSEVCQLRLEDVDLVGQKLTIRKSKSLHDRIVPLSPSLLSALKAYLPLRGQAHTDRLLTRHGKAIQSHLIRQRLDRYGKQAQVQVSPHRLRHTLATRLLNEGMPITSLRRLLGHKHLNTTLVYARVHDETVLRDFQRAYARLTPASSLADELFDAPTTVSAPHTISFESDCV